MKILIIQDFLRSGGTERQSILLANAFAAAGHATTLLTFRPGGALAATVSSAVVRHALQPFDFNLDWFAPGLTRHARTVGPDVVVCMGRMANCYAGRLQAEFPRVAVIATMRTGRKLPALFVHSLKTVRHVVANSRDARDTLIRQYAVPAEKVSVIYNSLVFPPTSTMSDDGNARSRAVTRRELRATDTTSVLLCVAMFRREKNQRELIEIAATLPTDRDWQLWLGGEGPALADCQQRVATLRLESRVKFLGFQRDPSRYYLAADIAVHASYSEALSNFLIEAQAHGLPAVACEAQGIEECFIPNETGWAIPHGRRPDFCAAILRLMNESAAARAARSASARAHARQTFSPENQVTAYLELFARLLRP